VTIGQQLARFSGVSPRIGVFALTASLLLLGHGSKSIAQAPAAAPETVPGQRFLIEEPITSESLTQIKAAAKLLISRATTDEQRPVLVFEFRPGKTAPGASDFGSAYDLANVIANDLAGARKTVAYIPEPLRGYAVLPALACDEIVMGSRATIGPITPEGQSVNAGIRELVKNLALHKGREAGLFLGLLDPDLDLRLVRTADKQVHHLLAEEIADFSKTHQIIENVSAWEGARRGVLLASRAREEGFTKLLSDDINEVFSTYRIDASGIAADPSLLAEPKAVWIKVEGQINTIKERYIAQRVQKARIEGVNLIFFEINSAGGVDLAASNIAQLLSDLKDVKTVAYINDRATGVAALIPLACDDIVFRKTARMGNVSSILTGGERGLPLSPGQVATLTSRAASLATAKGHPAAIAAAMVDPDSVVVSAKDAKTGAAGFYLLSQTESEPGRYLDPRRVKEAGQVLTLTAEEGVGYGMGRRVSDDDDLKSLYRLRGKTIRVDGPTWVDGLVQTLNDPFISGVLLFIGIFMLILEIKMPGVGLPAITSVLAFLLFFWSRFLSGTADQLEILLFVVGIICLGLELFVFPGFGVFGISGVLLILISIVMASHTFVWPTQEYEYRQMMSTLFQVTAVLVSVGVGIAVVGRFLPSIPLFNKMILKPEVWEGYDPDDPMAKPSLDSEATLSYLIGETGRTTTILRPSGKARIGDLLVDVSADGFYLEPNTLIEVVDVQGARVIVRPVR
jgi:membrane-bound serine protease (ClpP class)